MSKRGAYPEVVVDLPVVAQPQKGEPLDPEGLHAVQLVHDGQPVEAEAAVGEAVDVLEAEGVRPPVGDLHGAGALRGQAVVAAEKSPNATHLCEPGFRGSSRVQGSGFRGRTSRMAKE